MKRKCATCLEQFDSFVEYNEHLVMEHQAIERGEPFVFAYHGGAVQRRPGGWRPMSETEKLRCVDAGERRLGRHHFIGHKCEEVTVQ